MRKIQPSPTATQTPQRTATPTTTPFNPAAVGANRNSRILIPMLNR